MRIVYVEDNIANVFLVQRVAKMGKHEVVHYIDGDEFLRKYEKAPPDLILMDIQLSGGYSGLDLVRKLRGTNNKVPVIAITAYAMVGDRERCLEAGCTDYMAKPLAISQLVDLFEHYAQKALAATEDATASAVPAPESASPATENIKTTKTDAPEQPATTDETTDETTSDAPKPGNTPPEQPATSDETASTPSKQDNKTSSDTLEEDTPTKNSKIEATREFPPLTIAEMEARKHNIKTDTKIEDDTAQDNAEEDNIHTATTQEMPHIRLKLLNITDADEDEDS